MFDAKAAQQRLTALGLLDPGADGKFGPVSRLALGQAMGLAGSYMGDMADEEDRVMTALQKAEPLPLALDDGLASRIVRAMLDRGDFVGHHRSHRTIAYVEGADYLTGNPNDNAPNKFNDARYVISLDSLGAPKVAGAWEATTEPSRFWTQHPMNPKGAARIKFGQYKAWAVGTHHAGSSAAHEALVQVDDITVCRDLNEDFKRDGDKEDAGDSFGVNQHWGYDLSSGDLGRSSAGCLVGRTKDGHRAFMGIVKSDPRFVASHGYRFMTSIFPVAAIKRAPPIKKVA